MGKVIMGVDPVGIAQNLVEPGDLGAVSPFNFEPDESGFEAF